MPSSIKMIKGHNVIGGETTAKIATQVNEELYKVSDSQGEDTNATQLRIAKQKAQDLIQQAEQKRQQLLEETKQEIEALKEAAYNEAYQVGKQTGHQEGFNHGLSEGLKQAEINNQQAIEAIQNMREQVEAEVEQYKLDHKQEWIQLASHMAEKIVHKEIDASDQGILELAGPYFYQLEKDEELVSIMVHPSQREHILEHLPEIEIISPNTRFIVYGDPKLEEKGMVIEGAKAVIDLQIKKQLEAMLQLFDETERTVDA